jgi:hypothetical protein
MCLFLLERIIPICQCCMHLLYLLFPFLVYGGGHIAAALHVRSRVYLTLPAWVPMTLWHPCLSTRTRVCLWQKWDPDLSSVSPRPGILSLIFTCVALGSSIPPLCFSFCFLVT